MLRIGEPAALGISAHVLRAWEPGTACWPRSGHPAAIASTPRLMSIASASCRPYLAGGLVPPAAGRPLVLRRPPRRHPSRSGRRRAGARPRHSKTSTNPAESVLDRLLTDFTPETVLRDVLLPYLHELGERWEP